MYDPGGAREMATRETGVKRPEIVDLRPGRRRGTRKGSRPTCPIKMPMKIMPHLAGASNEPIFGEVGLNFWD